MKKLTELSPITGFEYRGTQKSRNRLTEMSFCKYIEMVGHGEIFVVDKHEGRYFAAPYDWIIVQDGCVLDILNPEMFEARFSIDEG
jgi:hypothetical protein